MIKRYLYQQLLFLVIFLFAIGACEKEVDIELEQYDSEVVVDGYIEQGQFAYVYLTLSFPYFSKIDSALFFDKILSVAKVSISNGEKTEVLTLKKDLSFYPPLYYRGTEIKGEIGKTYTLLIEYQNKQVTAQTTIPPSINQITVTYQPENDTSGAIHLKFADNANTKDYYRTFYQVKNVDTKYIPTYLNTFDDIYFNGQDIEFNLYKGIKSIAEIYKPNKNFMKGDTVNLKISTLDKEHYDFWNSYQGKNLNLLSFTPSTNSVKSNINGGLGVWGGYASTYFTVICK